MSKHDDKHVNQKPAHDPKDNKPTPKPLTDAEKNSDAMHANDTTREKDHLPENMIPDNQHQTSSELGVHEKKHQRKDEADFKVEADKKAFDKAVEHDRYKAKKPPKQDIPQQLKNHQ